MGNALLDPGRLDRQRPAVSEFRHFREGRQRHLGAYGADTATTNWDIQQGTLQIGNGGASGSIIGDVANAGTLAFNRSGALTFGGVISGTGERSASMGSGTTTQRHGIEQFSVG